jgi:hypothetical protein
MSIQTLSGCDEFGIIEVADDMAEAEGRVAECVRT